MCFNNGQLVRRQACYMCIKPQECFPSDETSSDRPTETETGRAKITVTLTSLIPADANR